MPAGDRKMPEPTVLPTRIAMALHNPIFRGNTFAMHNATAPGGRWRVAFTPEMDLHHALFWVCAAITGVAELLILRAAFFPTSEAPPNANLPSSPRAIEILWGILPAFALAAVFALAWRTLW